MHTAPQARALPAQVQVPDAEHVEPLALQSAFEKHRRAQVRVSGSQPKSPGQAFARQSVGSASQRPALQTRPAWHWLPQPPQFASSVAGSMQAPRHSSVVPAHWLRGVVLAVPPAVEPPPPPVRLATPPPVVTFAAPPPELVEGTPPTQTPTAHVCAVEHVVQLRPATPHAVWEEPLWHTPAASQQPVHVVEQSARVGG